MFPGWAAEDGVCHTVLGQAGLKRRDGGFARSGLSFLSADTSG